MEILYKIRYGSIYVCYKHSKKVYRTACTQAYNQAKCTRYNLCNRLFRNRNVNKFWKSVKRLKNFKNWNQSSVITNETFYNYFSIKFKYDIDLESDHIRSRLSKELRICVTTKLQNCNQSYDDFVFKE